MNIVYPNNTQSSPFMAIVYHRATKDVIGATRHEIVDGKIKCGSYICVDEARDLLASQAGNANSSNVTLHPSHVLFSSPRYLIWHKTSSKKMMWYRIRGNTENFLANYPPLLFVLDKQNSSLSLYALGGDERPTNESVVYHAPLMNIYSNGKVCQGSAKLPKALDADSIDSIESTVFDSNFTHVNHTNTLSGGSVNTAKLLGFWRKLSQRDSTISSCNMKKISTLGELFSTL